MSHVKIPYTADDDFDPVAHRRTVDWVVALGLDPFAIQKADTAEIIPVNGGSGEMVQFEEFEFTTKDGERGQKKRLRDGTAITHTVTVPMIADPAAYGLEVVD